MRIEVIAPPEPVLELGDVLKHLKVDAGDEDDLIEIYMAAAQAHIDGPGRWLGRAIGVQTLEARLDNFDCGSIRLPCPPIVSVTSVKYVDAAGTEQTIATNAYEFAGRSLMPVYGASWPAPQWRREAVRVRYQAGYATLPGDIRAALLLMVGDLWRNRSTVQAGTVSAVPMSTTVHSLLDPLQVFD